jgi:hypothetical protein
MSMPMSFGMDMSFLDIVRIISVVVSITRASPFPARRRAAPAGLRRCVSRVRATVGSTPWDPLRLR